MFHVDVAKVDRDIAYVAMVVHVCYKLLFLLFQLFFHTYVAGVFNRISHICFTHILQVSYVVYVLHGF